MSDLPRELEIYSPEEDEIPEIYEMVNHKAIICVSDELMEHYRKVISTRNQILDDSESSGGEKAAILNSTTGLLKELLKMLAVAHSADEVARLQQAVYNSLQEASPELKAKVLSLLERNLESV